MSNPADFVRSEIGKTASVIAAMLADGRLLAEVERVAELCVAAIGRGRKLMFAGNGGSAADAQHLAAELVGRLDGDRAGLPALALTTDTAILTAVGNDFGYGEVFRRQVDAVGTAGDVLVAISTSGRSQNVLMALEAARAKGIVTVGMTGAKGAGMQASCDACLVVPSADTQKIQEGHIVLGHIVCGLIERRLFPGRRE